MTALSVVGTEKNIVPGKNLKLAVSDSAIMESTEKRLRL